MSPRRCSYMGERSAIDRVAPIPPRMDPGPKRDVSEDVKCARPGCETLLTIKQKKRGCIYCSRKCGTAGGSMTWRNCGPTAYTERRETT